MELPSKDILKQAKDLAIGEAKQSPCVRRKYGAVIFSPVTFVEKESQKVLSESIYKLKAAYNERVTKACNDGCLRDCLGIAHAENTDIGGEIHAEQAVLIKSGIKQDGQFFLLVGTKKGKLLIEADAYPCYSCARMIKFAGFDYVYIPRAGGEICPVSTECILEYYEDIIKGKLEVN
jgi:deoxycytidylate deaminase